MVTSESSGRRPFIGVFFDCCGTYQRVYLERAGTFFSGRCPRCAKLLKVKAAAWGDSRRMFRMG